MSTDIVPDEMLRVIEDMRRHGITGETKALYPISSPALRRAHARKDICPECGGPLDTGWECLSCGYDAQDEAYPPAERERDKRWRQP